MDYRGLLLALLVTVCMAHESCCSEEAEKAEGAEEEPLLGLLDYLLLAAIAGVCFWWFFMRESDSDKIPEVTTGTLHLHITPYIFSMRSSRWLSERQVLSTRGSFQR